MRKVTRLVFYFLASIAVTGQSSETNGITICWDTSYSMMNRNMNEDLILLDKVFAKNGNQVVQVLFFDLEIKEKEYNIIDGNWENLKNDLTQVSYDGANMVTNLEKRIKHNKIYVFTDGIGFSDENVLSLPKGSYLINTNPNRNIDFLNRTTLITKSRLIDKAVMASEKMAGVKENVQTFNGIVYLDNKPAPNIKLSVKGTSVSVISNQEGVFSITAKTGDSLLATSTTKLTFKGIEVGTEENINIFMDSNTVALDEVILVEERLNTEKTTAYGKQNVDAVGYAVQSITDEDILPVNTDVATAIRGKFSGVTLMQDEDLGQVKMRPSNSILGNNYGLIVIDGVPVERIRSNGIGQQDLRPRFSAAKPKGLNDTSGPLSAVKTNFIDPNNIAEITVLKGLAATNRYGSLGSNGVLLITTKTAAFGKKEGVKKDQALLTDNVYEEKIKTNKTFGKSSFLIELENSADIDAAYKKYVLQREASANKYEYFIDVFDYFKVRNKDLTKKVISNILEFDNSPYGALRAAHFKVQKEGFNKMALEIAKKARQNYPDKIQTYFDLAMAHKKVGYNQKAFDQLLAIADGSINPELNFSGLSKIVQDEIKNMIQSHKSGLDTSLAPAKYSNEAVYDARIIFEWNNQDAEFELQFVNPKKRFFKWEHTNLADKARIRDELSNGFSSEQFEIEGEESKGKWLINVNYLGNKTLEDKFPAFIKALVQYNFGRPNQKNEEYLIKLENDMTEEKFLELKIN